MALPATRSALKATPTPVELDRLEIVYGRPPPRLSAAAREWMAGSRLGAQENALGSRDHAALESAPHTNSARDASTCCWSRRRRALIARRTGRAALANCSRAASRCPPANSGTHTREFTHAAGCAAIWLLLVTTAAARAHLCFARHSNTAARCVLPSNLAG